MVQKDKFRAENFCKKLILALLIIFTLPLPSRSEIKIPIRKDCSLIKKKQNYDYYDRQEAHDFGRKIQALIAKKDISGIYKNVLIDELENGPRREFIKNKSFDEKFIKLARDVYKFNDERAKIKLAINTSLGSNIKEVKSYE